MSLLYFSVLIAACVGCEDTPPNGENGDNLPEVDLAEAPKFDEKNAYELIEKQLAFGPRIPGTTAHDSCASWLEEKLSEYGAQAIVQQGSIEGKEGKIFELKNIIGAINPEANKRILLCAHWDTRAEADQDPENPSAPVPGADDGGSGVAVLLEIARQIQSQPLQNLGVDIVLFDAEDQGTSGFQNSSKTWCLGAQYWSKNPHVPDYDAEFGILLDMVGARGARFAKEGVSMKHASIYVNEVWAVAHKLGYYDFFDNATSKQLVDDHVFVNDIRKIPTLDIINQPENSQSGFGSYWHTEKDNMDIISKTTLNAVGQTVLQVIYNEDAALQ